MNKQDFNDVKDHEELLRQRNNSVSKRCQELAEFYLKHSDETIKYLLYVNAGGVATSIGFMGASESARKLVCLRIALCLFALGVVLVGVLRVLLLHKVRFLLNNWRKDSEKYWARQIEYAQITANDYKRAESDLYAFVAGYASGASFVLGLILGGVSLFRLAG
jgi:hypothetical protein